jgi:hypothetical protein
MALLCEHNHIFCFKQCMLGAALFVVVANNAVAQAGRALSEHADSMTYHEVKKEPDTMTIGKVWRWSLIAPSFGQFFNKQYWKTPIVIGGIGGFAYAAYADKPHRAWHIAGAAAVYWASLIDAAACYPYHRSERMPSKAAIYAALLPGLGQIYNQKYWKLPLVYGGLLGMGYLIQSRHFRLNLFTKSYNIKFQLGEISTSMANLPQDGEDYIAMQSAYANLEAQLEGNLRNLSLEQLKAYKDKYRRDRDYYIILTCLFYGLSIIDAVVDAHFSTYDVSNNLSLHWQPFVERWAGGAAASGVSFCVRF